MLFIKLEIISFILNILFESSMPYKEREKSVVREEVLEKAVKILTESRYKSTLINSDYIYKVRDQLLKEKYWNKIVSKLKDETVQNWRNYYESIVSMKKPSQLRVAYLSGPNPENDLSVLAKLGILPEKKKKTTLFYITEYMFYKMLILYVKFLGISSKISISIVF